ncbi:GFA family protein [Tateyamaria sp.]|uniref:GFA family protein n=1 Tax=Tateyamaria sp. TaxID=1929288 RepID=UPI003B220B28
MSAAPRTASYCHCVDCRRWTGASVAAFAAFDAVSVHGLGAPVVHPSGAERWNCADCGSPLAARFAYLPDQTYVPVGILDQADAIAPALHSHADSQLPWLHIADDLPRFEASARSRLSGSAD